MLNNLLLVIATATVFLGTFYPLFIDAISPDKITVGAPYFDKTFTPIMVILILIMGVGPLLKWEKDSSKNLTGYIKKLIPVLLVALVLFGLTGGSWGGALGLAIAVYLATGTLLVVWRRRKILGSQPAAFFGFILGHLGMAVTTMAITCMTVWGIDQASRLKIGESLELGAHTFTLSKMDSGQRENYEFLAGTFTISKNGQDLKPVTAEQRFYPVRNWSRQKPGLISALKIRCLRPSPKATKTKAGSFAPITNLWLYGYGLAVL